jgi:gamma-glutamyl-gamma-aminobutyrate hydrolase PuuD
MTSRSLPVARRQGVDAGAPARAHPPLILMTPDIADPGTRPSEREYAIRMNYAEAIAEAGGVPLILPCEPTAIPTALAIAGGIVITGARPGAEVAARRLAFERELVRHALDAGTPLLGICHGMQVIGECLGGTVAKDLPEMNAAVTPHIPGAIPDELAHEIRIAPDSDIFAWHREAVAKVNSLHRHALIGEGRFRVAAWAADGFIEAFEGVTGGFCLGVQWHPEYRLTRLDRTLLAAFIGHCARHAAPALSPEDGG